MESFLALLINTEVVGLFQIYLKFYVELVTVLVQCRHLECECLILLIQWFPKWALPPPKGRWRDLGGR